MSNSVTGEIQKLSPSAMIELFELDMTNFGGDRDYFHPHAQEDSIWWQGVEYQPWAINAKGFQRDGDKPPIPHLSIGNKNGIVSALCQYYDDMVGGVITRRRTLKKFLDARNFSEGNPTANPSEQLPDEIWFIERKVSETPDAVEFELSSALDFNGVQLPRRQVIANICPWVYRGAECGYTGKPVADINDAPTSSALNDKCGKRLASCKLRFGENGVLPYGGFPAADITRRG